MKSQQAAEREEQQRIKNLVLNYDLREDENHDGIPKGFLYGPIIEPYPLEKNPNTKGIQTGPDHYNQSLSRSERSGRHAPRARRLNLSDVDWYGKKQAEKAENEAPKTPHSPAIRSPRMLKKPG